MPVKPGKCQRGIHVLERFRGRHHVEICEAQDLVRMVQRHPESDSHAPVVADQVKALKAERSHYRNLVVGGSPLAVRRVIHAG